MEKLRPALTMSDIYGPGRVFFSRAVEGSSRWLPSGANVLDSLTGGQIAVAGDMPIVCSEGFNSRAARDLLGLAGIELPAKPIRFHAGEELRALSRAAKDGILVLQHALPDELVRGARCWIELDVLRHLNNKANLAALVHADSLPPREVVDRGRYFTGSDQRLPIVLKAVSDESSGGGCAVMLCRTSSDLGEAEKLFGTCEQIVVEELLDIVRNPCLNFAVMPDGEVRYLGFADQDISPEGKYVGNWLDIRSPIPHEAIEIAMEPVRRGAAMGYRGFAGIDLAFTGDGRTFVLDLNFRANGCTTAILLAEAVAERSGAGVMHLRTVRTSAEAGELTRSLTPYVEDRRLVPLNLFDPQAAGYAGKPSSALVLVLGNSREEALAIEDELARAGIG